MAGGNGRKNKMNSMHCISIIAGLLGAISDGMHFGYSSPLFQPCNNLYQYVVQNSSIQSVTDCQQISWFLSETSDQMLFQTFYIVGAMAALLISFAFKNVATKRTITATSVISLISWIILASASSVPSFLTARVLAGMSVILTILAVPTYICEITYLQFFKYFKGFVYYAILLGIFIVYLLLPTLPYIVTPIIGAVLALIQLVLSYFIVESPYYLIENNKISKAVMMLKKIRSVESAEKELEMIHTRVIKFNRENRGERLFNTPTNKSASIKIIATSLAQGVSGIPVVLMNLHEILYAADISFGHALLTGLCFVLIVTVAAVVNEIGLVKRKAKFEYLTSVLSTLALLSLAIYFTLDKNGCDTKNLTWLPLIAIIIFGLTIKFDKGYFTNELVENLYPDILRYRGLKLSIFVQIISTWITIEIFQRLKFNGQIDAALYIIGFLNIMSTIFMKMLSTKNSNLGKKDESAEENEDSELIGDTATTDMTVAKGSESVFKGTYPQLLAVLAGTLTAISDGMQYGWTAPVLPKLQAPDSPVKVSKEQAEWLENLLMLGSFSGLSITMLLVDRIGRKRSILLASFVTVCIWTLTALAPRVEYIYVARAFAGFAGNMAFVATPMYIAEIAEQKIRGFLSSLIYLMMLFGILLIYSVAPYIPFYAHCLIGGLLAFTELCIFPFVPESPYYLLYKDQTEEAEKSLRRLRAPGSNIDKELEDIKAAVARQKEERGKIQDLILVPSNRKAMLIMAILNAAQHFSGISVLLMNTHSILEAAGSIYVAPEIAAILFASLMVVAASVACFTIDKFGRRTLLISSSLATGLCLMVLAVYFSLKNSGYNTVPVSWIPVVCVMCYALVFKLGLGMVPIVLTAELFPTKMKAYGMTLADGMYVIASLLSLQVYQRLYDSFGMQYPFYVFSVSCYIAAVFTYFFIPETKGKTLEQIQMVLKGKHVESNGKVPDVENNERIHDLII